MAGDLQNLMRAFRMIPNVGFVALKIHLIQLLRLTCNLGPVVIVYIYRDEIDSYITKANDTEGSTASISTLAYILLIVSGLMFVLGSVLPQLNVMFVEDAKKELQISQGTALVAKVFSLELDVHISTPTGKFSQLLGSLYRNVDQLLPAAVGKVYPVWFETVTATIIIGILFGPVCLVQVGLVLIYSFLALKDGKTIQGKAKDNMAVLYAEYGKLLGILQRYEIAHHFNNVDHEIKNTYSSFAALADSATKMIRPGQVSVLKLNAISLILTSCIVFILLAFTGSGKDKISFPEFAVLTYYYNSFNATLGLYAQGTTDLLSSLAEYQTVIDFVEQVSPVADAVDAKIMKLTKTPKIEFKHVSFSYGDKQILDDVSFIVPPGTTLAVTGASGAGKSTIMNLILRFYTPNSGRILVNDIDINSVTANSLRSHMAVVTQHTSMFNNTLRANVQYGKLGSSDDDVRSALAGAELDVDEKDSPVGLDDQVGEGGDKLSGGQKQRVAIARALLKHGNIFLLDEPTTALDSLVAHSVQTTLNKITDKITTLFVTHKLDHVTNVDQIIYLKDAKIAERGTYGQLMQAQGGFFEQVRSQNIQYDASTEAKVSTHQEEMKEQVDTTQDVAANTTSSESVTIHINED